MAGRLEAMASRLEAIASRLEATSLVGWRPWLVVGGHAGRLEAIGLGWRPSLVGWRPWLVWRPPPGRLEAILLRRLEAIASRLEAIAN